MRVLPRRGEFNAFVSQRPQVNTFEQRLSPAERDWRDGHVQIVNETRTQTLLNRVRPAVDPHVHSGSGLACTVERFVNASCDEVERGAACHLDGGTRVMGPDEDRHVIWRVVSPPASPVRVWPSPRMGPNMFLPRIPTPTF